MVGGKHSLPRQDLEHLVNLLEFSHRRLMANLRNSDTASFNIDPWILLRTSSFYLALTTGLYPRESPHVRNGIAACDEVVQALVAVLWMKRIQQEVIPVLRELRDNASLADVRLWRNLVVVLEAGVQSLLSVFATGRSDVSLEYLHSFSTTIPD